jgi:hypothetical protein
MSNRWFNSRCFSHRFLKESGIELGKGILVNRFFRNQYQRYIRIIVLNKASH